MSVYQSIGSEWTNNDPSSTEQQSSIGRLSGGRYVIAWVDSNGGDNNILAQIFNADGTTFGGQFVVNAPNDPWPAYQVKSNPTITMLENGNFVIAWDEVFRGTNGNGIMAHVYDQNGGSVGSAFLAGSYSNSEIAGAYLPHIVAAGGDQFYVLSIGALPYGSSNVFAQKVDSAGNILGGHLNISDIPLGQGSGAYYFDSTQISNGNVVVSYLISAGQGWSIAARIVGADLQPIGPEIIVDANSANSSGYGRESIAVAALAGGGFIVNWQENSPTASNVTNFWIQRYDNAGTAQGSPVLVTSSLPNQGYSGSDVAALDDGNFLVTWQGDGSTYVNQATIGQLFDAGGNKVGIPFHISAGGARYTQVVGIDGGGFAATYMGYQSQSGDVLARAFAFGAAAATHGDDIIVLRQDHVGAIDGLGGNDVINGNALNNLLHGGVGNDILYGGRGNDLLDGGADNDTATYVGSTGAIRVNLSLTGAQNTGAGGIDTLTSIENVIGSNFADTLTGNSDVNHLVGGSGNDKIDGQGGADILEGGSGNDTYTVDQSDDIVIEKSGGGTDLVNSSSSYDLNSLYVVSGYTTTVENLTLIGIANTNGTGNELANKLTGNSGDNILNGQGGKDIISGGSGDDRLIGSRGADTLTGGIGNDQFVFDSLTASIDKDIIKDFTSGQDHLVIDRSIFAAFAGDPAGVLNASEFVVGTKALTSSQHLIYNSTSGALFYDADGAGGQAQIMIALLSNHASIAPLDALDFLLI